MNFNERLKPNTEFIVYSPMRLSDDHFEVLNQLYLPLIGTETVMTYFYLHESTAHFKPLAVRFHKELMDALSVPLSDFMQRIEKLEGIGLMRTYVSNNEHDDLFTYELVAPLEAHAFFKDPMLSMYLYGKTGGEEYKKKRERLIYPQIPENMSEVTHKFTEVFNYVQDSSFVVPESGFKKETVSHGPNVDLDDFDFEVLFTHLKGTKIDKQFFNKEVRMLIVKLSVLFNLNAYDMKQILLNSTNQYRGIDKEKLKYEARIYYQKESGKELPVMSDTAGQETDKKPVSRDSYFKQLDDINPIDRLNDIKGDEPGDSDLKLVTDLIANTTLSNGVINVLLEYVFLKQEGELPVPYTMKIARDWEEKGYQTAEEAYQSVISYKKGQKERARKYKPQERRGERRPKWMDKEQPSDKKEESGGGGGDTQKTAKDDPELEQLIKEFREN